MIVPVMAISNLVLTRQIYSEETNGAHAHYREPVPLILKALVSIKELEENQENSSSTVMVAFCLRVAA